MPLNRKNRLVSGRIFLMVDLTSRKSQNDKKTRMVTQSWCNGFPAGSVPALRSLINNGLYCPGSVPDFFVNLKGIEPDV